MPQGEDLKNFVDRLRSQSIVYKERRSRLLELQAEAGVLARTRDILLSEEPALAHALQERANSAAASSKSPLPGGDIRHSCKQLLARNATLRADIAQVVTRLQDSKVSVEELRRRHQQQKEVFIQVFT